MTPPNSYPTVYTSVTPEFHIQANSPFCPSSLVLKDRKLWASSVMILLHAGSVSVPMLQLMIAEVP